MSVSNNVGGFKNRSELIEAKDDYKDMLRIRASLNAKYDEANRKLSNERQAGIPPPPPQFKTAEEEVKDQVLQNTNAFEALKKIMKPADASQVLSKLQNDNEVADFNRFSTLFLKQVDGQSNITPSVFDLLWTKYKEKILATGNTGIEIGAQRGEYETTLDEMADKLRKLGSADRGAIADKVIQNAINGLFTLSRPDLMNEFETIVNDDYKGVVPPILDIPDEYGNLLPKQMEKDASGDYKYISPDDMIQYILYSKFEMPSLFKINYDKKTMGTVGKLLPAKPPSKVSKADIEKAKDDYISLLNTYGVSLSGKPVKKELEEIFKVLIEDPVNKTFTKKLPATIAKIQEQIQAMMPAEYKAYMLSKIKPSAKKKKKPKSITGTGISHELTSQVPSKTSFREILIPEREGEWKEIPSVKNHIKGNVPFGKYLLSIDALSKGYLHIKWNSNKCIKGHPRTKISQDLVAIFNDLIFSGKFDEEDYNSLSDIEKKLFDDTLELTNIGTYNDVNLAKHKRYNSKTKKENIERFNLLKGQLLSGNDNKNILKEFKVLLIKMLEDGSIDRRSANKIFYELFLLE